MKGTPDTAGDAARVLVVEDEAAIREPLALALQGEGYRSCALADGTELESAWERFRPDLAILDVMLPGRDGFRLAEELRRRGEVPVLFLTGRDAPADRLRGFDLGGDDYVVKPFMLEELLARVRAVLRRSGRLRSEVIQIGDLVIDVPAARATRGSAELALTATEFRLLALLARHPSQVLSKLQILTQIWGYGEYDPNLVEVHVSALRRKLEQHGDRLLHTVRGHGYALRS